MKKKARRGRPGSPELATGMRLALPAAPPRPAGLGHLTNARPRPLPPFRAINGLVAPPNRPPEEEEEGEKADPDADAVGAGLPVAAAAPVALRPASVPLPSSSRPLKINLDLLLVSEEEERERDAGVGVGRNRRERPRRVVPGIPAVFSVRARWTLAPRPGCRRALLGM